MLLPDLTPAMGESEDRRCCSGGSRQDRTSRRGEAGNMLPGCFFRHEQRRIPLLESRGAHGRDGRRSNPSHSAIWSSIPNAPCETVHTRRGCDGMGSPRQNKCSHISPNARISKARTGSGLSAASRARDIVAGATRSAAARVVALADRQAPSEPARRWRSSCGTRTGSGFAPSWRKQASPRFSCSASPQPSARGREKEAAFGRVRSGRSSKGLPRSFDA